ncbi:FAD-dependent 5-carboxymethylaminomethyl-2-thiouridine(34) oxidoreductase MnmC [Roseateles sp. SL47]|uniref:FAD-dependent 5-carboxymethylaminomethyl-2-thiouridine(34) oxidoreductase MnmC n=1 Tax=Roseateles sp. SL47 TaxID=2995138 RepID=UPI0022701F99|nr:FAD-dependent 5-carboxymethylaminomethyl-2-thiouridine(34) oxidoreductase MnmC [Roseateles sp. SL47]WAC72276.1 FAD-dependent 5-carboxymethylaminomethyl-2-thiouridine(34) oxidoreductase MnmC [Roseateles sp. SL47]
MKTAPILPAVVDFSDASTPFSPTYGDYYHTPSGAIGQANHVFLGGNGLPGRWSGRTRFVVLETGFGLGHNFLATWAAWRADPAHCDHLIFISIDKHPLRREDLARAHAQSPEPELAQALLAEWPVLSPNLHTLDFEGGRVRLLLALGDVLAWLPALVAQVDAFYLDGFAPSKNPQMWEPEVFKQLNRLSAPGATAATWCLARRLHEGLAAVGFRVERVPGFARRREMTSAFFEPRFRPSPAPGRIAAAAGAREVLVVGAGLAGAACARALRRRGLSCTVLEAGSAPAGQASGNPGGLFHGTLHGDDGPHARFNRTAALATERELRRLAPSLPWLQWGLLRVERDELTDARLAPMQRLLAATGLPTDYVQALTADEASRHAGLPLAQPAWFFPGGGAVSPAALIAAWLAEAGVAPRTDAAVACLRRIDAGPAPRWQACDAQGRVLAEADAVVLAAGTANDRLSAPWLAGPAWPWLSQRGQLSVAAAGAASALPTRPVAGVGYALALPDGRLCFGASADAGDAEPALRMADQVQNLQRLGQLLPRLRLADHTPSDAADGGLLPLQGRVGWRSLVPDRLPIVGVLPSAVPTQRAEQARFWPRHPGLLICGGLASRGITWATLCGDLLAAQITGEPLPLESDLVDILDPARFGAKLQRRLC